MANVWDDARQVWVDDATGNYMKPTDRGGDGLWYSANGQSVYNASTDQWYNKASGAIVPTGPTGGNVATATGTNNQYTAGQGQSTFDQTLQVQPGLSYIVQQQQMDLERELARIGNEAAASRQEIDNQFQRQMAEDERRLSLELQQGQLDQEKYLEEKRLAQQESQFARTLALQQLEQETNAKVQQAQVAIQALAESRSERTLQAQLSANPQDLVAYTYLMRGLGNPQAAGSSGQAGVAGQESPWDIAQRMAVGSGDPNVQGVVNSQQPSGPTNQYPAPAPAYSNPTLQGLVGAINTGQGQGGGQWNPYLQGTGAFGANIQSPNSFSRMVYNGMSPTDMGILNSFLKAGIQTQPGVDASRVSINPEDYWTQVQKSFVPTLNEGVGGMNTYNTGAGF